MISNQRAFLEIAEDALAESERLGSEQTRPKSGGEEGFVHVLDSHQRSFKQACVALVFACCYLEALLYCVGTKRLQKKWNDFAVYEKKLEMLGVTETDLLVEAKRLRTVRKEITHEKALNITDQDWGKIYIAQKEATRAVTFVKKVQAELTP